MTAPDWTPAALAALHARCFVRPRPWTAEGFAAALAAPGGFLCEGPAGFALGRALAGEAELLTLAVDPGLRRQGHAASLLAAFEAEAARRGAGRAFLEVAADNAPARALYAAAGWLQAGLRRGYYGAGIDALILDKPLKRPAQSGA
ncbi:MAG: GNAT family N-acetyltransferase [Gemmobacter sp.]